MSLNKISYRTFWQRKQDCHFHGIKIGFSSYLLFANISQIYKYWEVNYMTNTHGKCHICLVSLYLHLLFFGMLTIFAKNLLLSITYFRHICKEQICVNLFFHPVNFTWINLKSHVLDIPEPFVCGKIVNNKTNHQEPTGTICSGYLNHFNRVYL